jgi:hypothetical protein
MSRGSRGLKLNCLAKLGKHKNAKMSSESYEAHWRAAACDAIPYHKDFPEWYTMTIELLNGGKKPTEVSQSMNFCGDKVLYRYRDNGSGCTIPEANTRLLQWASVTAVDGKSVYGHGTKKFLAKCGDYATLNFKIRSRAKGEKKIVQWSGPYKGRDTHWDLVEIEDFPPHGFEIEVEISASKLGAHHTPLKAFEALKEIICARKQQSRLSSIRFSLEVLENGVLVKKEDSVANGWKSFEETLATNPACKMLLSRTVPFNEGKVNLEYASYTTGTLTQIPGFPTYGLMTGGVGTRVHIANEDTMIEAHPWWDLHKVSVHPSKWHRVDFARFVPVDPTNLEHLAALPDPATTKVAFRYESPKWQQFVKIVKELYEANKADLSLASKESMKATPPVTPALHPRTPRGSSAPGSPATSFFAPRDSSPRVAPEPTPVPVEPIVPQPFETSTMNDLFVKYRDEGKTPSRYEIPNWLGCSEPLMVYTEAGKTVLVFYRQRQRGPLSEDLEKAYVALSRYANEKKMSPEHLTMIFCLHLKSAPKERVNEFEACKKQMIPTVYPYIGSLQLKLLKDM